MDYPQYIVEEEIFQQEIEKGSLTKSFINSTIAFMLGYLIVIITYQLTTIFVASYYQIETDWYFYKISYLAVTSSPLWNFPSIKAIFSAGPLISLFMGFIYFFIYLGVYKKNSGLIKLILLWACLHSFNRFFGDFVGGDVALQFSDKFLGFIYVTNWMYISKDISDWLAISSMIFLITIGYFSTRYFLSTAYSRYFLFNNMMKLNFKVYNIFLPAVVGTVIIIIIRMPGGSMDEIFEFISYNVWELITYATMLIMLVPVFTSFNTQLDLAIQTVSIEKKQRIAWGYIFLFIILIGAYRILLDPGLGFGLHFDAMKDGFDIDNYMIGRHKI